MTLGSFLRIFILFKRERNHLEVAPRNRLSNTPMVIDTRIQQENLYSEQCTEDGLGKVLI